MSEGSPAAEHPVAEGAADTPQDERKTVLRLVAEGKISVEDGERLLEAMGEKAAPERGRHFEGHHFEDDDPSGSAEERLQRAIGAAISEAIEAGFGRKGQSPWPLVDFDFGPAFSRAIEEKVGRVSRRVAHKVGGLTLGRNVGRRVVQKRKSGIAGVDEIVTLASMGIRPEYVREVRELLGEVSLDDLANLSEYGVRVEFIRDMLDIDPLTTVDKLIDLASEGVRPAYIRAIRDLFEDMDLDEIVTLASEGVRPEYVRELHEVLGNVSIDDVITLHSEGVKASYIRDLANAGIEDLTIDSVMSHRYGDDA